jgi:hypothetical protein
VTAVSLIVISVRLCARATGASVTDATIATITPQAARSVLLMDSLVSKAR